MRPSSGFNVGLPAIAVFLLLLGACGGKGGVAQGPLPTQLPLDQRMGFAPSEFQREILADGVVTFAEYEGAVLAGARCVADRGVSVEPPFWDENAYRFVYYTKVELPPEATPAEEQAAVDLMNSVSDDCWREYQAFVEQAWDNQSIPEADERARLVDQLVSCIRSAGVEVGMSPSYEDLSDLMAEELAAAEEAGGENRPVLDCAREFPRLFIIPTSQ